MAKMHPFWWFKAVPIPCPEGEQIVNGGFETGDCTGWDYAPACNVTSQYAHSGTYSVRLYENWITQLSDLNVPKNCIESFGFWALRARAGNTFIIYFTDGTDTGEITIRDRIGYSTEWLYVDLTNDVPDGKSVKNIKFTGGTVGPSWVDDVSLIGTG